MARALALLATALAVECDGRQEHARACNTQACEKTPSPDCLSGPVDAVWSEWGPWKDCVCDVQERGRVVLTHAKCGGEQASGTAIEARSCVSEPPCGVTPENCLLGDWQEWQQCPEPCGGAQQVRVRQYAEGAHCGHGCEAFLKETRGCNEHPCNAAVDCMLEQWSPWTPCTQDCGGGQTTRTRALIHDALNGGKGCGEEDGILEETKGCNEQCCPGDEVGEPQNCIWDEWLDWGVCTFTTAAAADAHCGVGFHRRQRHIKQGPKNGGKPCDAEEVVILDKCEVPCDDTPIDAQWGLWTEWGACSKTCDFGYTHRSREITVKEEFGGKAAEGQTAEYKQCNIGVACEVAQDCVFGEWSQWSACSQPHTGIKTRSREIVQHAEAGGMECGSPLGPSKGPEAMRQAVACNLGYDGLDEKVPELTMYEWSEWSACSQSCEGGTHQRTRQVSPQGGGGKCVKDEEHKDCNDDGIAHSPELCADLGCGYEALTFSEEELESCNDDICCCSDDKDADCCKDIDCAIGTWTEWSACTGTCNGGEHNRYREIATLPKNLGLSCLEDPENLHLAVRNLFGDHAMMKAFFGGLKKELGAEEAAEVVLGIAKVAHSDNAEEKDLESLVTAAAAKDANVEKVVEEHVGKGITAACESLPGFKDALKAHFGHPSGLLLTVLRHLHSVTGTDELTTFEVGACNTQPCGEAAYCIWGQWEDWSICEDGVGNEVTCGGGFQIKKRHMTLSSVQAPDEEERVFATTAEYLAGKLQMQELSLEVDKLQAQIARTNWLAAGAVGLAIVGSLGYSTFRRGSMAGQERLLRPGL